MGIVVPACGHQFGNHELAAGVGFGQLFHRFPEARNPCVRDERLWDDRNSLDRPEIFVESEEGQVYFLCIFLSRFQHDQSKRITENPSAWPPAAMIRSAVARMSAWISLPIQRCRASRVRRGISGTADIKFTVPQDNPSGKG
jgi:hypothetical protein